MPNGADDLIARLLAVSDSETVCLLDSCGVSHLGSRFMIAGVGAGEIHEFSFDDPELSLRKLDEQLNLEGVFSFLTISYDFGRRLLNIGNGERTAGEPDIFVASFPGIVVHDYKSGVTSLIGRSDALRRLTDLLANAPTGLESECEWPEVEVKSNFTRIEYLERIAGIQESIRAGQTYQTNLTQKLSATLPPTATPRRIFARLRKNHPAPFASFYTRRESVVVSASPERFFRVAGGRISTSPIKGTRPRGVNEIADDELRRELIESPKDRAENVMIVDLLRNDLGRVCEFGSVEVEKLCELEVHPSLFHLVSTVAGTLRRETSFSDIVRAVFPCGSITGAPKISTMKIIDRIETANRGLSMGAIGFARGKWTGGHAVFDSLPNFDLAVAIRTMTIQGREAMFHVGGGIVIDSLADDEYDETLTKAAALLDAIRGRLK